MTRIVVVGDLNLDVLAEMPAGAPRIGEVKTTVRCLPGGSGASFARRAASEGVEAVFVGCVGDDLVGELLVRSLEESGIETRVGRVGIPTGTVVVIPEGEKSTILCSRGANDGLDIAQIADDLFENADHLHVSGYSLISPAQREAAIKAMIKAREACLTISVDPPPANLIRSVGREDFRALIAGAEMIFPNLAEGRVLSGESSIDDVVGSLASDFRIGAVTLGVEGSIAWEGSQIDRCPAEPLAVGNATGAGDAFAAGFVVEYLASSSLAAANRRGNDLARLSLQRGASAPAD